MAARRAGAVAGALARAGLRLWLVLPLALLLLMSLAREWPYPLLLPPSLQASQWQAIVAGAGGLSTAVLTSLSLSLSVATLATLLGFLCSGALCRARRRRWWLLSAHLPFVVSPVVLAISLLYAFLQLGLAGSGWGVALAQFFFAFSYAVLLCSGFWNTRIADYRDLATTLGARPRQVLVRVLLPRAAPLLGVCFFQTFLISWFDYALAAIIGSGRVSTLTLKVFEYFNAGDFRLASAAACLLLAPPLIVLLGYALLPRHRRWKVALS